AELVQLAQAIEPIAGRRPGRDDEPGLLQVAKHAGGPTGACGGRADMERIHLRDLNTSVSRLAEVGAEALGGCGSGGCGWRALAHPPCLEIERLVRVVGPARVDDQVDMER